MTDYTTGDFNLTMNVKSEKDVTIDFVVNEATEIWREMRSRKIVAGDMVTAEAFMQEMQRSHSEFSKSYPIVFRYICQMQLYDAKIFQLWLEKNVRNMMKSENEYLDSQADYVTMLFHKTNPRATRAEMTNVRKNIRSILGEEHRVFKENTKKYEKIVSAEEEAGVKARAADLRELAANHGKDVFALAETYRVEGNVQFDGSQKKEFPVPVFAGDSTADDLLA